MKKIILLLGVVFSVSLAFGQLKIVTNGDIKIGDTDIAPTAKLEITGATVSGGNPLFKVNDGTAGFFSVRDGFSGANQFLPFFQFKGTGTGFGGGLIATVTKDLNSVTGAAITIIGAGNDLGNLGLANANLFMIRNASSPKFTVRANGDVGIGTTSPAGKLDVNGSIYVQGVMQHSDRRLKKNINEFDKGLQEILKINPVTFQYNGKGNIEDTETIHVGIIAQEFQKVAPVSVKVVKLEEKRIHSAQRNNPSDLSRNNVKVETNDYLSVNDRSILFMLVNAVQQQNEIIKKQNKRIIALEAK